MCCGNTLFYLLPTVIIWGKCNCFCFIDEDTPELSVRSYSNFFVIFKRLTIHLIWGSYRKSHKKCNLKKNPKPNKNAERGRNELMSKIRPRGVSTQKFCLFYMWCPILLLNFWCKFASKCYIRQCKEDSD